MNIRLTTTQAILVIVVCALNIFAITQGFIYGSFWGITLAIGSIGALWCCIHIIRKIQELNRNEDEVNPSGF